MIKEKDISFAPTGDPFVDAGSMALEYISKQFPDKTLMELIEWAAEVYVDKWKGKVNSTFHGSPITHPTTQTKERIPKTMEIFRRIIKNISNMGTCRLCGLKSPLSDAGRDKVCLVGSGAFVNFHHLHEEGLMVCPDCLFKYFFLPFGLLQMGNMALLQAITAQGKEYWVRKTVIENLDKIGKGTSDGLLKSEFKNPQNAIFGLADELIREVADRQDIDEHLTLYYFTNFAASVDCEIYTIPQPVFKFVGSSLKSCPQEWYSFVRRHYRIGQSNWDEEKQIWRKKGEELQESDYLNNRNDVFNSILEGRSVLSRMCKYYKNKLVHKKDNYDTRMAEYYAKEVLGMTTEQIKLIKRIGNSVFDIMKQDNDFKRYMVMLEGAAKAHQLRTVLVRIVKKNYVSSNEKPIVTFEEWVNYLFPDGQFWGEIRDLLLIFLYEKMHEHNISVDVSDETEIEEPEEQTNDGA